MKTLGCLPWMGEMGWNIAFWSPLCRYHAQNYDYTIVAAPSGSEYLYEFADEFIPLNTIGLSYCDGILLSDPPIINADVYLSPKEEFAKYPDEPERISTPRKWRCLAPENPVKIADILCAFRSEKKINGRIIQGKEYPFDKCQKLVNMLIAQGLSVACFGGIDNYCPNGAKDLRGKPLEEQCSNIAAAKCVIGPSSGPIHLASLCKCPHITWTGTVHHTLKKRYEKFWNPFNTPVKFICHSRIPSPREIINKILEMIK